MKSMKSAWVLLCALGALPLLAAEAGEANGTAVIVAPGGGFEFLSIQSEGVQVARWLAARGITAFVLKYRINATPADLATYEAELKQRAVELHVYEKGGHGYGMNRSGASSDHWIEEFYWWLEAGGLAKAAH